MTTVAVICEYNPFHNGHKFQIDSIRKEFGDDCAIIAIMSGNYTQRGEIAVLDKLTRAKCACDCGVNLVLELPFPFSCSSAEFFATAAVSIANSLGTVDYLSFGSECGDIEAIKGVAQAMLSDEYSAILSKLEGENENKKFGYPVLCSMALGQLGYNTGDIDASLPNNILAIEYIKALIRSNSKVIPHTVKRAGAGYNDPHLDNTQFQSASSIRADIKANCDTALDYVPIYARIHMEHALSTGEYPCDESLLNSAVLSHFRLNSPKHSLDIHDASGGLYNRLIDKSFESQSIQSLVRNCATKKFTDARIRRVIWYSLFGVTSSDLRERPFYTQLLAMDDVGRGLISKTKKEGDISIVTKPSKIEGLPPEAARQKQKSDEADSVFQLSKPAFTDGNYSLRLTPYVKKGR